MTRGTGNERHPDCPCAIADKPVGECGAHYAAVCSCVDPGIVISRGFGVDYATHRAPCYGPHPPPDPSWPYGQSFPLPAEEP
jgi:hypothetical protein